MKVKCLNMAWILLAKMRPKWATLLGLNMGSEPLHKPRPYDGQAN